VEFRSTSASRRRTASICWHRARSGVHPQTLLAYELNGQPLTPDHGAFLRLVNLRRTGKRNRAKGGDT
jgi:Oxidoreductase molybdopterin binding domain